MKPNRHNEEFFINLVKSGVIQITDEMKLHNTKTHRDIGYRTSKGYIGLGYKEGKKVRHILAHRLIWLCLKGPIKDGLMLNHIDGNKANNKISNLELVTNSENCKHAYMIGLKKREKTESQLNAIREVNKKNFRFSKEEVDCMIVLKNSGHSYRAIGTEFNASHSVIMRNIKRFY